MRRPGAAGSFWPTPLQEQLLRAALLPDEGADVWRRVRPQVDVDLLPGELHRLIPLLARTLADAGVDDPDLARLRGVRQFTWYRNQRLFAEAGTVAATLAERGIQPLLIRGAATTLRAYGDVGLRPMNDLDLLVRPDEVEATARNLRADGWRRLAQPRAKREAEGVDAFANPEGRRLLVHWRPSRNLRAAPVWWEEGERVQLGGAEVATMDAEAHLVQLIADGARALSGSTLRWIADATMLLQGPSPAWSRVAEVAGQVGVSLVVADALAYLREIVEAPIPDEAVRQVRSAGPSSLQLRMAHRLSGTDVPRFGRMPELLGRHLRLAANDGPVNTITALPHFLQAALGVDRATALPVALARRAAAAIAGRGAEGVTGLDSPRE
ncbi:MAG TPA: nucleotidyltransferase family protein [Acidimicrobiales bacterium]|nr:nucleotidyltransferase family protein [Acidimicrobiales bacterium]